jgi:hypothetical protein
METPDKIYVTPVGTWDTEHIPDLQDNVYIRKGALLKWVKEQRKDCERVIREHPEDESLWCERDKYDELIDKLDSM